MTMTPADRLITAVNCQEPDCVPVTFSFKSVYFHNWARAKGRPIADTLAAQFELQLDFFRQWPAVVPAIGGPLNQGAVGLLYWLEKDSLPSDTPPPSRHWSRDTVSEKLNKASIPDPYFDGWLPDGLNDWQRHIDNLPPEARRDHGGLVWTFGVPGPLGSVGTLLSYPETFRLLYDDPRFLHELLELHTLSVIRWINAVEGVFARSDLRPPKLLMAEEMLPMISPAHAREFFLPYASRIYAASQSPMKIFHCDNRVMHLADVVSGSGANVFFGNFSDYSLLKQSFGGKMALMGNVPSLYVVTEGSASDVDECCAWLIERCGPGGGLILSSGGGLDPSGNTPLENVNAMVAAATRYGRYPLAPRSRPTPAKYTAVMSLHFAKDTEEDRQEVATDLDATARYVCQGSAAGVADAVRAALAAGVAPERIFHEALCRGLGQATTLFYQERCFFPEMEMADRAFQAGLDTLGPSLAPDVFKARVVIGSSKGSFQESGIRVIEVMLRAVGLKVINLGRGVDPERFIDEAVAAGAQVIAMGVYFYRHMKLAEQVTRTLRERGLNIKTLAGGMGITPSAAHELDVDAYAADGRQAQQKVLALLSA